MSANGDELLVTFPFGAVPTSPIASSIEGVWQVPDGTGRFDGAFGSRTYTGEVEFSGPASVVGHFELEGTLSSPGSLK